MAGAPVERTASLSTYLREIKAYPVLSRQDERLLAERPGGPGRDDARQALITSNLGFVVTIACAYRNLGLPLADLVCEGNLGLLEGARRFDPARGNRFITFAVWWVRRSILKALRRHSALVRIPEKQVQGLRRVREAERRLSRALGRQPDREAISRDLGVTVARLDQMLQLHPREVSLDEPLRREGDAPFSESLPDTRSADPERALIRREHQTLVRAALNRLRDSERAVLVDRFGLDGDRDKSLTEIGLKLGVSRERVRQIEAQARKSLRRLIARRPFRGPMRHPSPGGPAFRPAVRASASPSSEIPRSGRPGRPGL